MVNKNPVENVQNHTYNSKDSAFAGIKEASRRVNSI
jgi:hypothetical protein